MHVRDILPDIRQQCCQRNGCVTNEALSPLIKQQLVAVMKKGCVSQADNVCEYVYIAIRPAYNLIRVQGAHHHIPT